jgi:hypothetical protein
MSPVLNQPSPGPAHDQLPGVLAIPGEVLTLVPEDADLDPNHRDALFETHGQFLFFGPVLHGGLESRHGPDRRGLSHSPGVQDRNAQVFFKTFHQGPGGGGPTHENRVHAGQVVRSLFLLFEKLVEQVPDRGDTRRGGHSLRLDQLGDRPADHHRARQDLLGPGHGA